MKIVATIARYLLGLVFTVFGLNGFLHFIPQPPLPDGPARQFMAAMGSTRYLDAVFAVQLACGLLLLANLYVPLALVVVAGVVVNILLFHATMAPSGIAPGLVVAVLWVIVAIRARPAFAPLLRPRVAG